MDGNGTGDAKVNLMTRPKTIMLLTFVLAMGAGVSVGVLASRTTATQPPRGGPSWLIHELDLTPVQQQQMKDIWMELVGRRGNEMREQMMALQQEREAAIVGLLDAGQSQKYEQINQQFMQRAGELWKRVEQDFLAAAEKTRQLLNETQRKRYDTLVQQFQSQHANGEWFGMGMSGMGSRGRGPSTSPSTGQ